MACAVRILKGSTAKALAYIKASRCEAVAFIVHVGRPQAMYNRWTYQKHPKTFGIQSLKHAQ